MSQKLERLYHERTRLEAKLRKAQNDEKAITHQVSQLTRAERTHRLCTRGGMLEAILKEPALLTDEGRKVIIGFRIWNFRNAAKTLRAD